jgi:surface protein
MDEMFSNCESLTSLPNISVWDTSQLKSLIDMFSGCKSLTSFPKLTAWNMSKVINMEGIFNKCNRAIIPDINIQEQLENDTFLKSINYRQLLSKIYENENILNYIILCLSINKS